MTVEPLSQAELWLPRCITDGKGKTPLNIVANVLTALAIDSAINEAYAFNAMTQTVMLMHPIINPLHEAIEPRPLTDCDITDLQEWLQMAGLKRIGRSDVYEAVQSHARKR